MAGTATGDPKAAAELAAAKALVTRLQGLADEFPTYKTSLTSLVDDVKALKDFHGAFKDVDIKKTLSLIDDLRQKQVEISDAIRLSKRGLYVPGLGEEKKRFSIRRAAVAIVSKNWDEAGFENEVFTAVKSTMTKGTGHIIGVDSQGGFFVPDQVIPDVIQAIYAQSVFLALDATMGTTRVAVLDGLQGIPVTIPKFLGGMIAYWLGEQDKYVESAAKVANTSMSPKKLGVLTRITDEMRRFSSYGFEALMRYDMQRAVAALIDYTIAYGTGTANMPRGIINVAETKKYYAETHSETAPAGAAVGGELNFDDLENMKGIIEDANIPIDNSFAFVSHQRYFRRRRQDKVSSFSGQTTNQQYLLGKPNVTEQDLKGVIGDYGMSTLFPTKNTAGQTLGVTPADSNDKRYGDVIAGNLNNVVVGRWGGVEMSEDQGIGKGFPTDETYIKMRMYMDIGYRYPQALVHASDVLMRNS